jgi:integrase
MPRKRTGGIEEVDGRVYARVTVTLEDGRKVRRRVRLDATMTKREARREAKRLSKDAESYVFEPERGGPAKPLPSRSTLTVEDFHARWADDRERRGRVSERGRYDVHIKPVLGSKLIVKITKDDARRLSAELDEKVLANELHWTTAVKAWGVATKMFKDAVESKVATLRVLDVNPFAGVRGPERGVKKSKQWLYPSEVTKLLACQDVPIRWRRLYALSVYLYTRPEELAALECEDVNLEHGYVFIHRAVDLRTGEIKPTKTKRTRKVPIKPALVPLLSQFVAAYRTGPIIRSEAENREIEHGLPPVEDLAATLRAHLLRAGVPRTDLHAKTTTTKRMTFYDLRATGITWEAVAKTEMLTIMQRAGHDEPKTTLGYIREAESVGVQVGTPFLTLPSELLETPITASDKGLSDHTSTQVVDSSKLSQRPQRDSNPQTGVFGIDARSQQIATIWLVFQPFRHWRESTRVDPNGPAWTQFLATGWQRVG